MAPVGSRESLAAIQAEQILFYFGIENLNMRSRSASAFTIDDLWNSRCVQRSWYEELPDGERDYLR